VATAVLFGLLPALHSSRGNLVEALKEGGRGASARGSRLRNGLVVAQVSLALVSLVAALLFVRTFANLDTYQAGFDPKPLMTMRFYLAGQPYEPVDAKLRRVEDIVRKVEALPNVQSAFVSNLMPLSGGGGGYGVLIDGQTVEPGKEPVVSIAGTTPHFHRTLGVTMMAGRDFTDSESWSGQRFAVVNKTMADRFWADRSAVGGRFRVANNDGPLGADWFTVIGVAPDVKHDSINPNSGPQPAAYVPFAYQQPLSNALIARVADASPSSITAAVRETIQSSDRDIPLSFIRPMEDVRRGGFWQYGLFGWIFGVTGVVGLLLASVGVYGVLSYHVTQRSNEIGVRMALGAARADVLKLIIGHGMRLTGVGVIVGLALAPLVTWFGRTLFYNVSPFDPLTFAAVALFLLAIALLASYLPARRATIVDPVQALRQ
jgi:predicted permease